MSLPELKLGEAQMHSFGLGAERRAKSVSLSSASVYDSTGNQGWVVESMLRHL